MTGKSFKRYQNKHVLSYFNLHLNVALHLQEGLGLR